MNFILKNICRGFGTAYIPLKSELLNNQSISVKTENGLSVPFSLHPFEDLGLTVVAIPLLDCRKVCFSSIDGSHSFGSLSYFQIKWASRINYKFNSVEVSQFRDIENDTYFGQIHVRCDVVVESFNRKDVIVKGTICAPADSVINSVYLLNGEARPEDHVEINLGRSTRVNFKGFSRQELSFSLRLPNDGNTYCLVAESNTLNGSGFLCFDPAALKYMLAVRSPYFYKLTAKEPYKNYMSLKKRNLFMSNEEMSQTLGFKSTFSIVVPLFKTPISFLREMIDSVESQVYKNWELILVNASPEDEKLFAELRTISDPRIKIIELEENLGIAENTNVGINAANGDYIVFFDHDDTLDPFALFRYAERINDHPETDALYCDEDFLNEEGEYVAPHFKSDFNLDLLRVHNYITHLLCVRSSLAKTLMLRKEFDGAQDYDFLLRLVEKTHSIYHAREVLYHWRISDSSTAKSAGNKNYADDAGRRALQEHLDRCGLSGTAELTDAPCFYHVTYKVDNDPLVSIVIPNKDSVEVLRRCIDSVEEKTEYKNFEVLIIENNSVEQETFDYYDEISRRYKNLKVITWDGPFNYSAINNFGVKETKGQYLLFLNNDTEVIEPRWLSSMLSFCQREDVGAVGAKLLYPDNTVQHAGVMMIHCNNVNEIGGPIHVFNNLDRDDPGYMRRAVISQDLSAVTAACMLTKRSIFDELNGFNEDFVVAFNDVDYCLRVRALDKLIVFDADALLYHYESFSRGYETGEKQARFMREQGKLRTAWAEYYVNGDPYHSPMSTR